MLNILMNRRDETINEFEGKVSTYDCKPYFWFLSYLIGTISDRSTEAVKHDINSQKDQAIHPRQNCWSDVVLWPIDRGKNGDAEIRSTILEHVI